MLQSKHFFYSKREEWRHSRETLGQARLEPNRANTNPYSSVSSIWSTWWNHLGSTALDGPTPLLLPVATQVDFLLESSSRPPAAFLSKCLVVQAFPAFWGLHGNLSITFPSSCNDQSSPPFRKSSPATLPVLHSSLEP